MIRRDRIINPFIQSSIVSTGAIKGSRPTEKDIDGFLLVDSEDYALIDSEDYELTVDR